jgi:hypothetical protein
VKRPDDLPEGQRISTEPSVEAAARLKESSLASRMASEGVVTPTFLFETGTLTSRNPNMATINGAHAVRRQSRVGSIEVGKQADLAIYNIPDYREIPYFAAVNFCTATFKRGAPATSTGNL